MKLTFRLLDNSTFDLELDSKSTIKQVKEKIEQAKGADNFPVAFQKVIFSGKVLEDDKTLEQASVPDNGALVLFCKKPKNAATPKKEPTPTPTPTPQPEQTPQTPSQPTTNTPQTTTPTATPLSSNPSSQPKPEEKSSNTGGMVMGSELNKSIDEIVNMGFDRPTVIRAMKAAYNYPPRAIEYLLSGNIPEEPAPATPQQQTTAPATPQQPTQGSTTNTTPTTPESSQNTPQTQPFNMFPGPGGFQSQQQQQQQPTQGTSSPGSGVFEALKNHPQFNMLRLMVQQNPNMLQPILQQIGQTNPQLLQLINQNQQEFINLLNTPISQQEAQNLQQQMQQGGMGAPGGGQQYLQVTQEEKEAIDRLEKLGFRREAVIEAFFACDKNENLAANYLFENGNDMFDDEPAPPSNSNQQTPPSNPPKDDEKKS